MFYKQMYDVPFSDSKSGKEASIYAWIAFDWFVTGAREKGAIPFIVGRSIEDFRYRVFNACISIP